MVTALQAAGPHPSLGEQAAVFDRFVGTWDLDCALYAADGKITRFRGAWIFGWVLDGQAMQDVLIEGDPSTGRRRGTTVRFFDAKASQWRVLWIPPASGNVIALRGGTEGDRIVLLGQDGDGSMLRWSFNDIQPNSFLWRGETSADGGKTWRIEQEMILKRRTATPKRDMLRASPPKTKPNLGASGRRHHQEHGGSRRSARVLVRAADRDAARTGEGQAA